MTSLLQLSRISFDYAGRQVLSDLSLDLQVGSCTALAGPNGAGKTTLLRIAAGTLGLLGNRPAGRQATRKDPPPGMLTHGRVGSATTRSAF